MPCSLLGFRWHLESWEFSTSPTGAWRYWRRFSIKSPCFYIRSRHGLFVFWRHRFFYIVVPFRNLSLSAGIVTSLIASLGLALILEDLFVWWQGWEPISTNIIFPTFNIMGLKIPGLRAILLGMAAVTIGLSTLFLKKTDPGRSMRALAQDKEAASLYGINPGFTSMGALGLATILAGVAGIFYSSLYPLGPREGLDLTLKALFIVVAGGMGNLRGPAVAGLVLGFIESFAGFLFTYTSTDTVVYSLLVGYLVLKRGGRRQ